MPSVKIPKKSTDTDMTPFVDVAFLILAFFIMATKFKPPEPVDIKTPKSVSTEQLPENDAMLVEMDKDGKVFFTMLADNKREQKRAIAENLNTTRNLGLTKAEIDNFVATGPIGVPFSGLKQLLATPVKEQGNLNQPGIPISDSLTNELYYWVRDAVSAFAGTRLNYLIKIDNGAKYPQFKRVLESFKRNEIFKFKLITSPTNAPIDSPLDRRRKTGGKVAE